MLAFNIIAIIFALIALIGLISFIKACYKVRLIRATSLLISTSVITIIAITIFLIALNIKTYISLTHEQNIATLSFSKLSPQTYKATLVLSNGQRKTYTLRGDQWMISSQVLKWKPIAIFLDFKTLYRLDRLSGRYNSIEQEIHSPRSVFALQPDQKLDVWNFAKNMPTWSGWFVDASYGNAVFMPMGNGDRYEISLGQDGLIARMIK